MELAGVMMVVVWPCADDSKGVSWATMTDWFDRFVNSRNTIRTLKSAFCAHSTSLVYLHVAELFRRYFYAQPLFLNIRANLWKERISYVFRIGGRGTSQLGTWKAIPLHGIGRARPNGNRRGPPLECRRSGQGRPTFSRYRRTVHYYHPWHNNESPRDNTPMRVQAMIAMVSDLLRGHVVDCSVCISVLVASNRPDS